MWRREKEQVVKLCSHSEEEIFLPAAKKWILVMCDRPGFLFPWSILCVLLAYHPRKYSIPYNFGHCMAWRDVLQSDHKWPDELIQQFNSCSWFWFIYREHKTNPPIQTASLKGLVRAMESKTCKYQIFWIGFVSTSRRQNLNNFQ